MWRVFLNGVFNYSIFDYKLEVRRGQSKNDLLDTVWESDRSRWGAWQIVLLAAEIWIVPKFTVSSPRSWLSALLPIRGLFHDRNTHIISLVSQKFCARTYQRVGPLVIFCHYNRKPMAGCIEHCNPGRILATFLFLTIFFYFESVYRKYNIFWYFKLVLLISSNRINIFA